MQFQSHIEISHQNLINNICQVKKFLGKNKKIAAVVKSNAYGHGQYEVTKVLENYVDYFQVDDLFELKKLRETTRKPTLVLGYVTRRDLEEAVLLDGIFGMYSIEEIILLNQIGKSLKRKVKIHIKIDTGLGRQGLFIKDIDTYLRCLRDLNYIQVEGICSHFANASNTEDESYSRKQLARFKIVIKEFEEAGYNDLIKHISATAGMLVYEKDYACFDMVRVGACLYGFWPSDRLKSLFEDKVKLTPVMTWNSLIAQVKKVPKGFFVGYDLTYVTPCEKIIAVIPQGYGDGYSRALSNIGHVLVNGERCQVLGRVSMNMIVVDISNINNVQTEDKVVLLGSQDGEEITANEMASKIGTTNYEVVSRISPLLPRIVC